MSGWIELHGAAIVHAQGHATFGDALDGPQLAVSDLQIIRGRGELDAVSLGEATRFLAVDRNTLLAVRV